MCEKGLGWGGEASIDPKELSGHAGVKRSELNEKMAVGGAGP